MSRKIFLSFLGTNDYIPCYYYDELEDGKKSTLSKYVQTALIELYGQHFSEEDKFYFFLTDEAEKRNWVNDGQYNRETGEYDKPNKGLKEHLEELNIKRNIIPKRIPEGFSSEQVWEIFETVQKSVKEKDEVYLDITHAFRSIPMLGMSLLNYLKIVKNIKVKGIFYGAFEKLGRIHEVRKMEEEDRLAPIINLQTFSELQDWTLATNSFVRYGKTDQLKEIAQEPLNELARNFKGKEEDFNYLRKIFNNLNIFSDLIETNRGIDLKEFKFQALKQKIDKIILSQNIYLPAYQANLETIRRRIEDFDESNPLNFLNMVRWARENGMLQQAITQLKEGITSYFAQKYEILYTDESKRKNIERALYSLGDEKLSFGNYLFANPLSNDEEANAITKGFRNFSSSVRNDINHNGIRDSVSSSRRLKKQFDEFFQHVEDVLNKKNIDIRERETNSLLNLTNHPSTSWPSNQKKTAIELYGAIHDMQFPRINPALTENELAELVNEYLTKVINLSPTAVHIMGEMTFTFRLVNKLKENGIKCVASTTERVTRENKNGEKISTFKFVQFREY